MTRPRPSPSPQPAPPPAAAPVIGVIGLGTTVIGAALVLISLTLLTWYGGHSGADAAGAAKFGDLRALTKSLGGPALARAYFNWLAWVALILVIALGLGASVPSAASRVASAIGLVLGLAGAVFTYLALSKLQSAAGAKAGVFDHAQLGLYLALIGFVVAGVGAALGSVRPRV